ncbi:MAG TPA: hypothetical protein VEL79_18570, partial [Vicinamibacterales bacterium]|nr:hypothetical protein [Vicinamibacterales bacterium]
MRSRTLRLTLALTIALVLATLGVHARQLAPGPARSPSDRAIQTLAGYHAGSAVDQADTALKRIGYSPFVPAGEWAAYPPDRKFYVAYLAAIRANPTDGGEKYLALLAHNLARLYDPARLEPALKAYLAKPRPAAVQFLPPPSTALVPLPADAHAALMTLADYHGGASGSPRRVLVRHFHMSDDEAASLLRRSASNRDAFAAAAAAVSAQARDEAIRSWTSEVHRQYDSARHEPALQAYLPPAPPEPPSPHMRPNPQGGGGAAAVRFGEVMSELPVRGFSTVGRIVAGPGGVVFGNSVTAAFAGRPFSLRFVPSEEGRGSLQLQLSDGSVLVHDDVPAELAYVARRIATDSRAPLAAGDAIGIVGITDNTPDVSCEPATLSLKVAQRFHTAVNPALVNREIGWAALMVDSLPVRESQLLKVVADGAGAPAAVALRELLDSPPPAGMEYMRTWKVVDVPIVLRS